MAAALRARAASRRLAGYLQGPAPRGRPVHPPVRGVMAAAAGADAVKGLVSKWKDALTGEDLGALCTDDFVFVRPSGNPLTLAGFKDMMASPDMQIESSKLLAINATHVGLNSAMISATFHDKFTFKGTPNDDISVFMFYAVNEEGGQAGEWKVKFAQRSTGRKPEDALPVFP